MGKAIIVMGEKKVVTEKDGVLKEYAFIEIDRQHEIFDFFASNDMNAARFYWALGWAMMAAQLNT